MARIVFGAGSSHGPQLMVPPEMWKIREAADRKNPELYFRGEAYDFSTLARLRIGEGLAERQTPDARQVHFDRCQRAKLALADAYEEARPDVAVIIGNDQFEVFTQTNVPAFSVFWGSEVENIPKTAEQMAMVPPGASFAEEAYCPPERTSYPCEPELGRHIIDAMISEGFDVAQSVELPVGRMGNNCVPHAYGYIYRQVMRDKVVPHVPLMVNTHNPPNRPLPRRCLEFGQVLADSIDSWNSDARVAVIASGGLSHYVIDEALDRAFLEAAGDGDIEKIAAIPARLYESGTAELRNWLPMIGAMVRADLRMTLIDYVPCYRSEAGTGNAMGFAYWNKP